MDINNLVQLYIQFNGHEIKIPINPEKLRIEKSASNQDIDILGIGKATRKGDSDLSKTTIESFFPSKKSPFFELTKTNKNKEGTTPKEYIDFIMWCWNTENVNNNVPKLVTFGLEKDFDGMPFVIEDFSYEYNGGDIDVNYSLSIKQYREYGVKLVDYEESGMKGSRVQSPFLDTSDVQNTYTVQSGDCLWNITKACCGDGSRWKELYNINADVIGSNPNSLRVGQVLTLPDGWNTPTKVDKLKPVNNSNKQVNNEKKTTFSTLEEAQKYAADNNIQVSSAVYKPKVVGIDTQPSKILSEIEKMRTRSTPANPGF